MIGICCKPEEYEAVREFFELFKTPWEFHVTGRDYDVVISTVSEFPETRAGLTIVFASEPTELDARERVPMDTSASRHIASPEGVRIPIYGRLARFGGGGHPLLHGQMRSEVVGFTLSASAGQVLRIGYDLFGEIAFLLSRGQPVENASVPTLELHIELLRKWIVAAGLPLVEIPPVPWGCRFMACLTHDVDFAGIRRHKLDHTLLGFVYRASVGSLVGFLKRRYPLDRLVKNWLAVLSLPFVYAGILDDFWAHFDRYAELEQGRRSTFFLIPYKHRMGDRVTSRLAARRAAPYDIQDVREPVQNLLRRGFEIGVHGIDAWHSVEKGRLERHRVVEVTGQEEVGVRMHWLCFDADSPAILERAGYDYDATFGYNETVGYRAGTTQVFRSPGTVHLLELPLHIQDTALFYPGRLGLTDSEAWQASAALLSAADRFGGVLTVSWHERSLAPERLWTAFYRRLLREIDGRGAWYGSAAEIIRWFRGRRSVTFEEESFDGNTLRLRLKHAGPAFEPCLTLRVHRPAKAGAQQADSGYRYTDFPYAGEPFVEIPLEGAGVA